MVDNFSPLISKRRKEDEANDERKKSGYKRAGGSVPASEKSEQEDFVS